MGRQPLRELQEQQIQQLEQSRRRVEDLVRQADEISHYTINFELTESPPSLGYAAQQLQNCSNCGETCDFTLQEFQEVLQNQLGARNVRILAIECPECAYEV